MRILVTCPPMLGMIEEFIPVAAEMGHELVPASVVQTLSEEELITLMPEFEGWIIGDDPATRRVFEAGKRGRLRAAVKWGIGVDNVDFDACKALEIPISNTPSMFGGEVADVAICYLIGIARHLFQIDREIRLDGAWPKPSGISLAGKTVALVGFGDIGRHTARRLSVMDMTILAYDPANEDDGGIPRVIREAWPNRIHEADFIILTCALNEQNYHMLNADVLSRTRVGVQIVNVARGALIDEIAMTNALMIGHISAVALDVFEEEPLPTSSPLRGMRRCVFGSHNSSNSREAVRRASLRALEILTGRLNG